jgi:hypothetical protein
MVLLWLDVVNWTLLRCTYAFMKGRKEDTEKQRKREEMCKGFWYVHTEDVWREVKSFCSKTFVQKLLFENFCSKTFVRKLLFENFCSKTFVRKLLFENFCSKTFVRKLLFKIYFFEEHSWVTTLAWIPIPCGTKYHISYICMYLHMIHNLQFRFLIFHHTYINNVLVVSIHR